MDFKDGVSWPEVEMSLLRRIIEPKHTTNETAQWRSWKKRRSWQSSLIDSAKRTIEDSDMKMRMARMEMEKKISERGLTEIENSEGDWSSELSNKSEENP